MADVIRVIEQFGDSYDRLLLNPTGTLVGAFHSTPRKSGSHTLALYSAADGRPVGTPIQLRDCRGLGFVDDKTLVIANGGKLLRWKVPGKPREFGSLGGFNYALTTQPGLSVFGVCIEGSVGTADVKTGKRLWTTDGPLGLYTDGLTLSPRGRVMASQHSSGRETWQLIVVIEVATGRQLRMHWSDEEVDGLTFAPDDDTLFAFKGEGQKRGILVYAGGYVNPVRRLALPREIEWGLSMHFTPDGLWLDVIDATGARARLDPTSGRVLQRHKSPRKLAFNSGIAVSANGKVAAAVTEDFTVAVWPLDEDGTDGDGEATVPTPRRRK